MSNSNAGTVQKAFDKRLIIETILFIIYAVLTLIGALNHELWIDEAQAWNIARDNDFMGIINAMSYEGHPPLWHFILHIFALMGFGWRIVPIISWAFNVITVALIIYKFKFNTLLKAAIIFSAGFLFYNSVISRVYCLIPLILCCIALAYPNRKKYPLLYGGLVALLANTHVFVCGIVGALGILMLVDLFKDWKKNKFKNNMLNIAGLIIAAAGVLILIFMIFNSMENNCDFEGKTISFDYVVKKFMYSFENIAVVAVSNIQEQTLASSLWAVPIKTMFIVMLLLLLRRPRAFLIEGIFVVFYIIVCEVIWITLPNRAAIFLFSFAFSAYIARQERPIKADKISADKISSSLLKKLVGFVSKCYKNDLKIYEAVLCITMAITIPIGASYLFQDYYKDFNAWRKVADYIEDNIDEKSIIVTEYDGVPELSAYLPEREIYNLIYADYYTYISHKQFPDRMDYEKICSDLSQYEHIYYLEYSSGFSEPNYENSVLVVNEGLQLYANMIFAELVELDDASLYKKVTEYNKMRELMDNSDEDDIGNIENTENITEFEYPLDENVEDGIEIDLTLADAVRAELGYAPEHTLTRSDLESVTYLGVFETPVTSLRGVSFLINLSEIHISSGYIEDISELNGLQNLSSIDISNCYIESIPDLSDCPMLTSLYLVNNLVKDISPVMDIPSIRYLSLENNRISSLAAIKDITWLDGLGIDNNCILDYYLIETNEKLITAINNASQAQYAQMLETENRAKEIVAGFGSQESELELEKLIYQYIIDNMEYEIVSGPMAAFGYYGIFDGVGVCGNYAEAFCLLACHAGLETYVCSSETHAWNIVKIDGQYYHCDALWDEGEEIWIYFNRSGEYISGISDHEYDVRRYPFCE